MLNGKTKNSVERDGGSMLGLEAMLWAAADKLRGNVDAGEYKHVVLGLIFLLGQSIAWHQLGVQHIFFHSNPSSHFFFLITYAHAIHLSLGVLALLSALVGLYISRQMETRQILVDCTAWYWHSMGIFWVFLFSLLVFFQ